MKLSYYFALTLSAIACQSAFAKDASPHPVLLITGSPIQQSIEGSTEQLDEYDNQAIVDAGDLLTRFPGFSAIRAGGHAIDPVLRGQSQTRINLLQQGAFLHGAGPNRMDSPGSYTEPFGWDELQVIKGVETLVFGSGGPAGTLNFKRYKPYFGDNNYTGKLMAAYSPDYYKVGADLAAGNDQGYIRLVSQQHHQDSYEDGDGNITRTAFETSSNTLIAGYTPDDGNSEIRFTYMANRGKDALFAGTMMDGPTTDMDAAQLLYLKGDQHSNDFSEYQIYWNDAHHVMDNYSLRTLTAPMKMLTDSHSTTTGAKWLKRWKNEQTVWQIAADWQNVERHAQRMMGMPMVERPTMLQSQIWPENELDIKGIAIEAEYLFNPTQRLKSGVRFDRVEASMDSSTNLAIYQTYYANVPLKSNENNISAFSRFYHQQDSNLYWAGLSSTVRTADATERYLAAKNNMPMMRWVGNPSIQPERHNQLEIGAKWKFQSGWHELSIYHDQVNDFILRDRARSQSGITMMDMATIYRNTDADFQGFEWALNTSFADSWNFYTNVAYVKGENKETNQPLYQIPPIEGLFQISQQSDQIGYWFDIKWALKQDNVDSSMITGSGLDTELSDNWVSLDFKLRYELPNNWQLSFGINNLLDESYAYHVSRANMDPFNPEAILVNEPGRQIWLSILTEL